MGSRVARRPISLPKGVDVKMQVQTAQSGQERGQVKVVTIKGPKGQIDQALPHPIATSVDNGVVSIVIEDETISASNALAGTLRALINNHVHGVAEGFSIKLRLVGVGFRAQAGKTSDGRHKLDLTLGFSHPVEFIAPLGVQLATPSQTDIEVSGVDKQMVGQAAANIRAFKKPEPYKGKGIRYADEVIILKETKKK